MKKILIAFLSVFLLAACSEPTTPTVSKDIESPVFGAQTSKANLVIFTDFQCPSCIYFEKTIGGELFEKYVKTDKITLTYKNYPLPFHKNAYRDALAAMCALSEGKYKEYGHELYAMEEQKQGNKTTDDDRVALTKKTGLDTATFTQCLNEGWYMKRIDQDMKEWDAMGLEGTPSVYLNGTIMKFKSKEEFFGIIDAVLNK